MTTFGKRIRELRRAKSLTLRELAPEVNVGFTYLSKIENERLDFAQFPSEELICKLATALECDEDELLILAKKVPSKIKERVFERPEVFAALADCDDKTLDKMMSQIGGRPRRRKSKPA
ncbi:helix-turn-helix domain-containing protein [Rhodopirellula sallentina]|uniref:helix-turn-helix domain-containing protein n=1 Tax=Rhodopirellula sallentina TaxID=1263869 RepID=UPI0005C7BE54|nr:helix-turn-helix transcriptional regulator [Rhodopirellula sallentina]